ncbi:hypothetical protein PCANC_06617 [Puccinia coronata f. sp. avenae]|uniref:Uncharacterized protein n=1 Tax=Puccinia coronata f. sp. avenae TaxID=200324 RepID=A0A2N5SZZ7_9BASI|nr:hypothetical protein PCANC_06617 [Puccinia coronata f. sp. avenae]
MAKSTRMAVPRTYQRVLSYGGPEPTFAPIPLYGLQYDRTLIRGLVQPYPYKGHILIRVSV